MPETIQAIYDPASARVAAEAVRSMTKKILALELPDQSDKETVVAFNNTIPVAIFHKSRIYQLLATLQQ